MRGIDDSTLTNGVEMAGARGTMVTKLQEIWESYVDSSATADAVYSTLRDAIVSGHLQAGDRLNEQQLAAQFGVSRTPVREALHRLETEEFANRIPRGGMVVRAVSRSEVLELYAVRVALDALAARTAAQQASPADRAELRWIQGQMAAAAERGDIPAMLRLNLQFHGAIYTAAHNGMLLRFGRQLRDWISRFRETSASRHGRSMEVVEEHEHIVSAIEAGDPEAAEEAAREHMERACRARAATLEGAAPLGQTDL
jgi:DNA-binding GntR family transcriptional regulator